ncbi:MULTISPECIES: dihydroneopterin aldolase [Ancylobacter]|uniref:7,8-dihydroneopterin aldolase n=1 Tax=Ancylobacter defluvii TaxID=1282440 RepID=A0A9W6JZD6_9HYPH|nr:MULTISPECIES: dihydroneopterin aldolase [Ancylobacter]MBS7589277.1 dihydroneopterin aldolase [Ancylobacter defluvii]MDR6953181.1 dihydroneopterin aldolase [Ancylobacter sp. 3268]GLK84890.1 7,8-dihydroneopterin aldolase [Ancylobacter defluvii]
MSDRIFLRGIELHAYHGLYEEEARLGQRFVIDVDWWLDAHAAAEHDDYGETVGYEKVFETVHAVSSGHRFHILEAFAEAIAAEILRRYARVERVRVELHKPHAPIPGVLRDVGVEIVRQRN